MLSAKAASNVKVHNECISYNKIGNFIFIINVHVHMGSSFSSE